MKAWIAILWFTGLALAGSAAEFAVAENVPYDVASSSGADAYARDKRVLDIYHPVGETNVPIIVWFHGGGLTSGRKFIPDELRGQGICVVAPSYRLSPNVPAKTCVADAAEAVAWVFANIERFGGDPRAIFVSGHSAGGYLASMVGLDKRWLNQHGVDADDIAGLIPFSGHAITHFTVRAERGVPGHQPLIDEFAPLFHVRPDAPPLLMITGDRELELLGRYEENAYMMRMMRVAGHPDTRVMELDGYDHGMSRPAYPLLIKEVRRVLASREQGHGRNDG